MIDFSRKPSAKSADEQELDRLFDEYEEMFGKPYVFEIGINSNSIQETLADIRRRILEEDPQPEPEYKPGMLY